MPFIILLIGSAPVLVFLPAPFPVLVLRYCVLEMLQLLPQGNPAFLFLVAINKFFKAWYRIGILPEKDQIFRRFGCLVFLYGKINIILLLHAQKI